jgi:transposase
MRKIKEALRLRAEGFSGRRVAQSLTIARATISEYFRRADLAGLSWPLRDDLSDAELEARLYPPLTGQATRQIPQPDWGYVHSELRRKGVTLALLWQEYREVYPDGYGYSQYCVSMPK